MNHILKYIFCLLAALPAINALHAGNPISPNIAGTKSESVRFDKNGKVQGYSLQTVKSVLKTDSATTIIVSVEALDANRTKPEKSKPLELTMVIKDGQVNTLKDSFLSMIPEEVLAKEDMQFIISGTDIAYPADLSAGQRMPDYEIIFSVRRGSKTTQISSFKGTEREVIGKEAITTQAGTFECYKTKVKADTKVMIKGSNTEIQYIWLADGIGTVMSKTYTGKGKLKSTTELISLTNP